MSNYLIKLIEEKDESKIFSLISTPRKDEWITWSDILKDFKSLLPHKSIDKKYFWNDDLKILNRFGFDIDFEDSSGNTLLFHLFSKSNDNDNISFDSKDILKKTKKLYHINRYNENILFLMAKNLHHVDWKKPDDFITGQNLIDFIEQHPKLNLHQFNNMNRNIINMCLFNNNFPHTLFQYLKNKNVSLNHIDSDEYNILNFFPTNYFTEELGQVFLDLCQNNDITHKNKFKDCCISSFISFLSSNNTTNEKNHIEWLEFIFTNIIEQKIPILNHDKLLNILNVSTEKYSLTAKKLIALQKETSGFIKYQILNEKFPAKEVSQKKPKI